MQVRVPKLGLDEGEWRILLSSPYLHNFYVIFCYHIVILVVINVRGLFCWDFESVCQPLSNSLFLLFVMSTILNYDARTNLISKELGIMSIHACLEVKSRKFWLHQNNLKVAFQLYSFQWLNLRA